MADEANECIQRGRKETWKRGKRKSSPKKDAGQFLSHNFSTKEEFFEEYKRLYGTTKSIAEIYLQIMDELQTATLEGNVCKFKERCRFVDFITGVEDISAALKELNDKNPFKDTNLVILACKCNQIQILDHILSSDCNILRNLSFGIRKTDVSLPNNKEKSNNNVISNNALLDNNSDTHSTYILPWDEDENCHNAFYYAIRSGNVELIDKLITKWPVNYFAANNEALDEVLSRAYEELKIKNVPLTGEVEYFVENKLLGLRFFSSQSEPNRREQGNLNNIKGRIDLVLQNIELLTAEYLDKEKVDDKFLFVARFIAQNIHILKRPLRSTYDRVPWEEMEFCLVSFISSHIKQQEINLFYNATLSKPKILNYLDKFAKVLTKEKNALDNVSDVGKLAGLPLLKRENFIPKIISENPEFKEMYQDYQLIRDVHSLQKISDYIRLALLADPKEREGQLIIIRGLQIMGENLKNTLESPKLSSSTSELLLLTLPKNTREVITGLRNSLSHASSLAKRSEIEENKDVKFFIGIQKDIQVIGDEITDILYKKKLKMIRKLLEKISQSENAKEIQEVVDILNNIELENIIDESVNRVDDGALDNLIKELSNKIPEKTSYEKELFNKIDRVIDSAKNNSKNIKSDYVNGLITLKSFCFNAHGYKMDNNRVRAKKYKAKKILEKFSVDIESRSLKEIAELAVEVTRSARSRMEEEEVNEMHRLSYEIFYLVEFDSGDLNWIQKLRDKLSEKDSSDRLNKQTKSLNLSNDQYNNQLKLKLSELTDILRNNNVFGEKLAQLPSYKKNTKIQAVAEMLVLDILSILSRSDKHLENNLLFLDDSSPLLTGKCLRNHLAHDNNLLDILLPDQAIAIVLNAEKLITENVIISNRKMGKLVIDDPLKLKDKFDQRLFAITIQEKMYTALEEGNPEEFKKYVKKGADIHGKNIQFSTVLHFAAHGCSVETFKFLFEQNLDVNIKDMNGQNALHVASAYGRVNLVEFLITKAKMSVNVLEGRPYRRTPLHIAAKNGHEGTVEILLKYNANTQIKDGAGNSPLHYAVSNNHINIVKILLAKEINVDINETMGGFTSLHIAAEFGCTELVNFLLENNANVNAKTDRGPTPLHFASLHGHFEVAKALILKGSDVNCRVVDGCTPLHYAVENGYGMVANLLLDHGANVNATDKTYFKSPLHYAATDGLDDIATALLKHNANANIATVDGITPLHFAAHRNHFKIVSVLLEFGANISAKQNENATPLHYAAEKGNKDIAELLIKSGAKIGDQDCNNTTPLHVAAANGHYDVVELLVKNKAVVDTLNKDGMSPLHVACMGGHKDIIDFLIKHKADVTAKTNDGMTPLHAASEAGHNDIINFLIKNNAAVNSKNDLGVTPLCVAIIRGLRETVKILLESKASVNDEGLAGTTPLFWAVDGGHTEIVKMLVANGARIDGKIPLLMSAVKQNSTEIVEILIENGASVNSEELLFMAVVAGYKDIINILLKNGASITWKSADGLTLLHVAAKRGNKEIVNALIAKGAIVDAKTTDGSTPLLAAVQLGNKEVTEALIANKADVNFGSFEEPPLHMASAEGHVDIVKILIENGANVNAKDFKNRTSLALAIVKGHLEVVKLLLQHTNVELDAKIHNDLSALHIASQEGNLEMVKFFVDKGCDINVKNASGSKPVHIAARDGHEDVVKFFLSKGSSVEEYGNANQTLLHYAALKGQLGVAKFLIAKGANCNAEDNNKVTPMHFAAKFGHKCFMEVLLKNGAFYNSAATIFRTTPLAISKNKEVIDLLASTDNLFKSVKRNSSKQVENDLKSGAFVDARSAGSGTPLHFASWKGYEEVAKLLLQNKANPNAIGNKKFTPLHYATKFGHLKIVKALLSHGAVYNAVSDTGKTPSDLTTDKEIASLVNLINESFKKVKEGNTQVIFDLNKLKDIDTIRAVMCARDTNNKSIVVVAAHSKFPKIDQLKEISQNDMSIQLGKAELLLQQGNYQGALRIYRNALEKRKEILGPDNPGTLDIQTSIAKTVYKQGIYQEALNMIAKIYKKQKEILGLNDTTTLSTRSTKALVLHRLGQDEKALTIFRKVYKKQYEILGAYHTETIDTQFHMALVLDRLGKYDEAISINKAVYEMRKSTLGVLDSGTVGAKNNIAVVLAHQGKNEEALQIYKEVYEEKKLILGANHADTLRTLHNIAGVYQGQKKYHAALKSYQEVLSIQKKHLPHIHPDILNTQSNIANLYFEQGKWISALKAHKECLDQKKAVLGPNHASVLGAQTQIESISYTFKFDGMNLTEVLQHLQNDINIAANDGDVQAVKRLLENGADPNEKDTEGRTPLHFAVSNGHVDIVNILINNGAKVFDVTNKGNTPLHTATSKSNRDIVDVLLKNVACDKLKDFIDAKTLFGGTAAIHVAAKNGSIEIVKSLLSHGATFDIKNAEGKIPLDVCQNRKIASLLKLIGDLFKDAKNGNETSINKLKTVKSDELLAIANARNDLGNTLLQTAIINGHKDLGRKLLDIIKQ